MQGIAGGTGRLWDSLLVCSQFILRACRKNCDDAKGFDYPCGRRAAQALEKILAASRPLRCSFVDRDQYGRLVGNCNRADGRSIQKWLVEQGLALDWPRYSNGAFAAEQRTAKAAHRGVWQGRFDQPWDWRAANTDKVETVSATHRLASGFSTHLQHQRQH
nr:thermonuclease family protein [Mesorhizobium wenxiniae]